MTTNDVSVQRRRDKHVTETSGARLQRGRMQSRTCRVVSVLYNKDIWLKYQNIFTNILNHKRIHLNILVKSLKSLVTLKTSHIQKKKKKKEKKKKEEAFDFKMNFISYFFSKSKVHQQHLTTKRAKKETHKHKTDK